MDVVNTGFLPASHPQNQNSTASGSGFAKQNIFQLFICLVNNFALSAIDVTHLFSHMMIEN